MADAGKGQGKGFASCLQNILGELGKAEAYPDADPGVIQGIRELVVPVVQQQLQAADPAAQMEQLMAEAAGGGAAPPSMGAPAGPPPLGEPNMSRLPRFRGSPREQGVALERALSPEMAS